MNRTTAISQTTPRPVTGQVAEEGLGFFAIMGIVAACLVVACSICFCCCENNCREQSGTGQPRKIRQPVILVDITPNPYGTLV